MTDRRATLSDAQIERYSRQIILPQVGGRGQQQLLAAAVAVFAAGHTGAATAAYLAAAGTGRLGANNDALCPAIDTLNPDCRISRLPIRMTAQLLAAVARDYDVIVTDDGAPLNVAAVAHGTPLLWGLARGAVGYAAGFAGHLAAAPCFNCVRGGLEASPPRGDSVLADVVGAFVGTVLAAETIKIVLGMQDTLIGRLWRFDALDGTVRQTAIAKDPRCPICAGAGEG